MSLQKTNFVETCLILFKIHYLITNDLLNSIYANVFLSVKCKTAFGKNLWMKLENLQNLYAKMAIFSGQSVKIDFKKAFVFTDDLHLSMGKFKVGYCFTD